MSTPKSIKAYLASIGKKGGAAGTGKSKARTSEQARAASRARWDKSKSTSVSSNKTV